MYRIRHWFLYIFPTFLRSSWRYRWNYAHCTDVCDTHYVSGAHVLIARMYTKCQATLCVWFHFWFHRNDEERIKNQFTCAFYCDKLHYTNWHQYNRNRMNCMDLDAFFNAIFAMPMRVNTFGKLLNFLANHGKFCWFNENVDITLYFQHCALPFWIIKGLSYFLDSLWFFLNEYLLTISTKIIYCVWKSIRDMSK